MPTTRKPRASSKTARKAAPRSKPAAKAKSAKAVPTKAKKPAANRPAVTKRKVAKKIQPLDLSAFPPESINSSERWICLACVSDVFERHMNLAPRTAQREIKRYTPSIAELYAPTPTRPWFIPQPKQKVCPYCGSSSKWLAQLHTFRIESGKATDALRRGLLKSLPQSDNQFAILEEKATQ